MFKTAVFCLLLFLPVLACQSRKPSEKKKSVSVSKGLQDNSLTKTLNQARLDRGPDYKPRTKHFNKDGSPKYTNRLILETSPYLQQHAHNPVDWHPWNEEAFAKAKQLGRPIFLSIGYSTCHWCHVMEEESFEDEEIAAYINEHYIAIKVDREERPDIDSTYMAAVHAMGIGGGWPLNVWLTPEKKPFYGGTYFPPRDGVRGQRQGFMTVLQSGYDAFIEKPEEVEASSEAIVKAIQKSGQATKPGEVVPGDELLERVFDTYWANYDATFGGVRNGRSQNKFPSSLPLRFVLRYGQRLGKPAALDMATHTLTQMASGGMYDQIGGGFHRYSTDPSWTIPHFEKMLYDNGLLASTYFEAYQLIGNKRFAQIGQEILDYILRSMTSKEGGFYSATDADSVGPTGEREEGYYFSWTPDEFAKVVTDSKARKLLSEFWNINTKGNFEGRNVPTARSNAEDFASKNKLSTETFNEVFERYRGLLLTHRDKRPAPGLDDKVLSAWNGLMISAFVKGAALVPKHRVRYQAQAVRAADFILTSMQRDGRLLRSYRQGQAKLLGYLEDYSFFIAALLDLFELTNDTRWLKEAIRFEKHVDGNFKSEDGGFFMSSTEHPNILHRERSLTDGAIPSGNSIHILNLLRLYQLTMDDKYREGADKGLLSVAPMVERSPGGYSELLLAIDFRNSGAKQVVLVAPNKMDELFGFNEVIRQRFTPNKVVIRIKEQASPEQLALMPWLKGKKAIRSKATAYVCENTRCRLPTTESKIFSEQL